MSAPLPHDPVVSLEENLREVVGHNPRLRLDRRMTLVRRGDGTLVVHSPVLLEEQAMRALEAWGRPAFLVIPGAYHRLDAATFAARWREAKVLCPRGARRKVAEVVKVDGTVEDLPADPAIRFEPLEGTKQAEAVMIVKSGDRVTLVFNDALFNLAHQGGFPGFVMRHVTDSTGGPKVTRLFRLLGVADRVAFRDHLLRLAGTPGLVRILMAHGRAIDQDPAGTLRRVAEAL